jgi:hypothetical protein
MPLCIMYDSKSERVWPSVRMSRSCPTSTIHVFCKVHGHANTSHQYSSHLSHQTNQTSKDPPATTPSLPSSHPQVPPHHHGELELGCGGLWGLAYGTKPGVGQVRRAPQLQPCAKPQVGSYAHLGHWPQDLAGCKAAHVSAHLAADLELVKHDTNFCQPHLQSIGLAGLCSIVTVAVIVSLVAVRCEMQWAGHHAGCISCHASSAPALLSAEPWRTIWA